MENTITSATSFTLQRFSITIDELENHSAYAYTKIGRYVEEAAQVFFRCSDSPSGVMLVGGQKRWDIPKEHRLYISESEYNKWYR